MNQFIPKRIRIQKDVVARIERILLGRGAIKVALNQEVKPSDIIGSSDVFSGFRIINLATLLEVEPKDTIKYLKRGMGQRIYKGELLALKPGGIFGGKKLIIAPTDGSLDYINPETGELKMTLFPRKIDLPAGVYGIVEGIDNEKGKITIRAQVTRIYGMLGCGKLRDGILEVINKREDYLTVGNLSSKNEGHVLLAGSLAYKDAYSSAISNGVSGIIVGGINSSDYKSMAGGRLLFPKRLENDIGISVVVCEGFGSMPIGDDIYKILYQYNGKFISIDGNKSRIDLPSVESSSINKVKSTILPPIQDTSSLDEMQNVELKIGMRVRVVGNSFPSEQGVVLSIDQSPTLLPSRIIAYLATIETTRRKIKVPIVNLEAIDYI